MTAKTVVDVILGEAKAGSYQDMLAIASVISNRATGGRTSFQDVVSRTSEFNAYGKPLPSGVNQYRSMAEKAIEQVKTTGPIHNATFYATPKAQGNLPKGLEKVTSTDGHIYFTDPQQRPIYTSSGLKQIDYQQVNSAPAQMMAYNDTALPQGVDTPIPAMSTPQAPKGLAALVPSQNDSGLASYLTSDKGPSHVEGLQPDFQSRLEPFLRTVGDTQIYSGYRSPEHQARLFDRAVKKYGSVAAARKWVAPPGGSNHNRGIAADLRYGDADARSRAHKEAESFGLTFRMGHEPWHVEPIKGWDRQVNPEFGLTPINPPTPQPRYKSATNAAPFGQVQREQLGPATAPAPIDQSTNLFPSGKPQASDYSNYQMNVKQSILPVGSAAPTPADTPAYTPKASDYANYMMNARQDAPLPADVPMQSQADVPIPAPTLEREQPNRFEQAKRNFGNNIKEQLNPKTIAARGAGAMIGSLLGPLGSQIGAQLGPKIAERLNNKNQTGLFGLFGGGNQVPIPTNQYMGSSSSSWGSAQNQGATYTASDGATITGQGNGTYTRTSPITGGVSVWNADGSRSDKGY